MRLLTFLTCALFGLVLPGCMHTYHVESSYASGVGLDGNGCLSTCSESRQDERNWRGFWFLQPDRVRP
jgi:hypothetical protein